MTARRRAESDEKGEDEDEEQGIWGTWEELVLACAVSRHGTGKWDSVAVEVGSRVTPPRLRNHHLLTAQSCRRRYRELRRRYEGVGVGGEQEGDDDGAGCGVTVPWLDDLRRVRVAELRREVERYDVSIVSLQLKVKKLTEERSLHLGEPVNGKQPDPAAVRDGESAGSPPEPGTVAVKDEEEGRRRCDDDGGVREPDPRAATVGEGKGQQPGEGSCDGSSDTVAKEGELVLLDDGPAAATAVDPTATAPHPGIGSEAAVVEKESSDVQSSASQASGRKKRRGRRRRGGPPGSSATTGAVALSSSSPGESSCRFDEEVSRPGTGSSGPEEVGTRRSAGGVVGSRPLAAVFETVRSHKYGSVFRRGLPAQETARYRSLIRQHMDLDSIRRRLDDPAYSRVELFRDLLLVCANATVFFPMGSDEHTAAAALHAVVAKDLAADREQSSNHSASSSGAATTTAKPAVAPDLPAFLEKIGSALVACRKRSAVKVEPRRKVEMEDESEEDDEEKKVEEQIKNKPVLGTKVVDRPFKRGLRTTKARGAAGGPKAPAVATAVNADALEKTTAQAKPETTKASGGGDMEVCSSNSGPSTPGIAASSPAVVAKKRSAAGFLKRLNGSTPPPSSAAEDDDDEAPTPTPPVLTSASNGSKGGVAVTSVEQKKRHELKVVGRDKVAAVAPSGKPPKEEPETQPKRKGRPPKRKAAPPSTPPPKRPRAAPAEMALPQARLRGGNRRRD